MYGNEGDRYVQVKKLCVDGLNIDYIGKTVEIGQYYSVPHGLTALKYNNILVYVPDKLFEEHFVREEVYKQYLTYGDKICINANGNLNVYCIEEIQGEGHFVTLRLKKDD